MGNGNYIKLNRKIQKWGWYKDSYTKSVFLELLLRANYEPGEYRGVPIGIGQAVFGRKELAEKLGMSEQSVRTAINHLKTTHEISTKSTNKFTIVTIEKWDLYQAKDGDDNQQLTNNQPTTNQQLTTSKKERNKEIKNKYISNEIYSRETLEIVSYLNEKAGTRYSPKTRKTQDLIKARMNDGFSVDDFKTVIDKKADEWIGDPKMEKFLRPETLFSNKFEGYLNQPWSRKTSGNPFVDMMYEDLYEQDRNSTHPSNPGILLSERKG